MKVVSTERDEACASVMATGTHKLMMTWDLFAEDCRLRRYTI
jgi:hypothetical protein